MHFDSQPMQNRQDIGNQGDLTLIKNGFCDFKRQPAGGKTGFTQDVFDHAHKVWHNDLTDRDVNRHFGGRRHILPSNQRRTSFAQNPFANANNLCGFLGDGNELVRGNKPKFGTLPAQQNFVGNNNPVSSPNHRLKFKIELTRRHRTTKGLVDIKAAFLLYQKGFVVVMYAPAAIALDLGRGQIRPVDQFGNIWIVAC